MAVLPLVDTEALLVELPEDMVPLPEVTAVRLEPTELVVPTIPVMVAARLTVVARTTMKANSTRNTTKRSTITTTTTDEYVTDNRSPIDKF